jgi:autotransporter-associated beta strand protein
MTIAINRGRGAALGSFTTALLASAAYFTLGVTPASATCVATNQAQYDACVTAAAWLLDPSITVNTTVAHDGLVPANIGAVPGTLTILSGGTVTDTSAFGPGFFNQGVSLTINAGGTLNLNGSDATGLFGFDTFASLAGAGTLNIGGGGVLFGANNANTAFSGTVTAPTLNNFLAKIGTGTFTINNMTMAEGGLGDSGTGGGLIHSSGTANIKSITVGSGAGSNNTMSMSGGSLNITGTVGGVPCGVNCPALVVGSFSGTGVLNQTGGTITVGGVGVTASYGVGNQGGDGIHNISAGTLQLGTQADITNSAGLYSIGRTTGTASDATTNGTLNISGTALVDVQAGELINGDRDAAGVGHTTVSTINMTGGTLRVRNGANLWLSAFDNGAATDSIFNLNGGALEIGASRLQDNYLAGGGVYQFNLGNGTVRVIDSALVTSVNANLTGATATTGVRIDTNGIGATWNGALSGTGWLVKTGAGTLNLGGPNTYTGGTAFNGGIVAVDAFSDLGAATAGMSFNGGTLQLGVAGALSGRTGATSMAGSGTIDTNGVSTIYDGSISGSGALTKVGLGTLDLGGNNNAHTGALNINGGLLLANFGSAIGNTSAVNVASGAFLTINGSETIGSLAGAGQLAISPGFTMTTGGNNASTTWTGTMLGAGGALTKAGTGTFTINGNTSYTGLTTVSQGELKVNGTMADGLLIQAGATFSGNANITGNVTNSGAINPGNSPGSVIIAGNYIGGGVLNSEVQLNNAGAPVNGTTHDFLSIGGSASNTTLINVIPFAPSGSPAATTGNGIELVRVAGATGAGQFALAAPVFAGAYEYTLNYLPNYSGALDGYFLQSRIGEGLFGEAAMAVAGKTLISNCFRSTDELAGDGNRSTVGRAWAKVSTGNTSTGADTGLETDQDYTCGSGGIDLRVADGFRVGVSGGYGNTSADVTTLAGNGKLEGDGGMMSSFVGYTSGNMFANLSVGYGNINWDYQGPVTAARSATTSGMIGALQAGMLWPMGDWRLGATAELAYDGLECGNDCMLAGTVDDVANWTAKAGLRVDGTMYEGTILPFLSLAFSDSLDGASSVSNGTAVLETESQSSLLNARAGVTAMVGENTAIFLSGGLTEGLSNDVSGAEGTIGAKLHW